MPKALVTGITGMLGAHVAMELLVSGYEVVGLFRGETSKQKTQTIFELYNLSNEFEKIQWQFGDITKIETLDDAFEGINEVYHCAAFISFRPQDEDRMYSANVHGTRNLVDVALTHPIRKFCHVSSTAAVGSNQFEELTTEKHVWKKDEASSYAYTKKYAEIEVWRGIEEGLNAVIVNPCIIIGPGDWNQGSPHLVQKVDNGLKYQVPGANAFVDVRDVASTMRKLMESDISSERFLLIGENATFQRLFEAIATKLNRKAPYKEVSKSFARLLSVIEYWRSKIFGSYPMITKDSVESAFGTAKYSNEKILDQMDISFRSLEEMVENTVEHYINTH
jgi:nucleoside-diphosphate-sugar epimerase